MVDEDEWTLDRRQEKLEEVCGPVETLTRSARASKRDTAVTAWAAQVRTIANEVVEGSRQVIEDQSADYTLEEVDEELQLLSSSLLVGQPAMLATTSSRKCKRQCLGKCEPRWRERRAGWRR
jgi:hypothetical protein